MGEEAKNFTDEEQMRAQFASEFLHIMTKAMTSNCLSRCIKKPGVKLERSEETCLLKCMDAFLETWNITSTSVNRLNQKLAQELAQHHGSESGGNSSLD